ncbi:hypothetical protein ABIA27_000819 [Sinorhizobium fredii]
MNTTTKMQDEVLTDTAEGMSYLNRLPRRIVTLYLPMAVFVFVLLFSVLLDGDHGREAEFAAHRL